MSLIDSSYFVGPLTIAQLGQVPVRNDLDLLINRSEPEFLQAALGYELWEAFMTGLSETVIDQKWIDIRDGVAFISKSNYPGIFQMWYYPKWWMNSNRKIKWVGFVNGISYSSNQGLGPIQTLITDSGPNNPVSGTNVFTWSKLAGAIYSIERRGMGTMIEGMDYSLSNNNQTITLLNLNDVFDPGEIFILHFSKSVAQGSPSTGSTSPLAGYVYYKYMRDKISQAAGIGIVKADAENAVAYSHAQKLNDAWNQMSKDMFVLWQFLDKQGTSVYPEYDVMKIDYQFFKPVNVFNL